MMRIACGFVLAALLCPWSPAARAAPDPPRGILAGRIVEAELLTPIEGASIVVMAASRGSEVDGQAEAAVQRPGHRRECVGGWLGPPRRRRARRGDRVPLSAPPRARPRRHRR